MNSSATRAAKSLAGFYTNQKILRFLGLTAQRGWARLILGRFQDFVLSPGNPTAATHEPDSVSHEHRAIFPKNWAWRR
jgi:hypothetical protein